MLTMISVGIIVGCTYHGSKPLGNNTFAISVFPQSPVLTSAEAQKKAFTDEAQKIVQKNRYQRYEITEYTVHTGTALYSGPTVYGQLPYPFVTGTIKCYP